MPESTGKQIQFETVKLSQNDQAKGPNSHTEKSVSANESNFLLWEQLDGGYKKVAGKFSHL